MTDDNKNPWRFHPLFIPYKKYYEGKNQLMGRLIGLIIAVIIGIVFYFFF